MTNIPYSKDLCATLFDAANDPSLEIGHRPTRYETGTELTLSIQGVHPFVEGSATLIINQFLGGGFAGQVYRCRITALDLPDDHTIDGLEVEKFYAVKIIIPPSAFSLRFRNTIYWLAFQGPFSSQVNYGACRSGLILQKLIRRAARRTFGRETAIKDAFASFWDPTLNAYGEITEWIEGRMWLLEADAKLHGRKDWKTVPLTETNSPEYIAKRRFMANMVKLMHEMGIPEFARQYEWWTMKSQPNTIKRTDIPAVTDSDNNLCAIDFRAGLALLPWLPMSLGDIKLIFDGLFKRKTLVQFDHCDTKKMIRFFSEHHDMFSDMQPAIDEFFVQDRAYRHSLPNITHHGLQGLTDHKLRKDICSGLIEGYRAADLVDDAFARKLDDGGWRFCVFYLLGALPILGKMIRRRWGNSAYREHTFRCLTQFAYLKKALRAYAANGLIEWHRAGRTDKRHVELLLNRPCLFLLESFTLRLLPIVLHRVILRPARIGHRLRDSYRFLRNFITCPIFREKWFLDELHEGEKKGMLTEKEHTQLKNVIRDPFIIRYLKCLGIHFATVPITQIVSVIVGTVWATYLMMRGHTWGNALGAFGLTIAFFQVTPISPGSLCRGGFVVYLMIKERNVRDYVIAAPVSFLKYIGYLAFPLQMSTTYPNLARFMASRWATNIVHFIPVFGEKGALLEHIIFDNFFNRPQKIAQWAARRKRGLLNSWMFLGLLLCGFAFRLWPLQLSELKPRVNLILATIVLSILPRILFYPLMRRKKHRVAPNTKLNTNI